MGARQFVGYLKHIAKDAYEEAAYRVYVTDVLAALFTEPIERYADIVAEHARYDPDELAQRVIEEAGLVEQ